MMDPTEKRRQSLMKSREVVNRITNLIQELNTKDFGMG